jgi:hypothetical protein
MVNKVFFFAIPILALFISILIVLFVAMAMTSPPEGCDRQMSDTPMKVVNKVLLNSFLIINDKNKSFFAHTQTHTSLTFNQWFHKKAADNFDILT